MEDIMEKILIIGCRNTMDDVCVGCSRCMVAFNRREGSFERYKDQEAELIGLLNCGGCPGASIVTRLMQVKLWNMPLGEQPTKSTSALAWQTTVTTTMIW